jgi:tetratricopeptide (TPR) repeat protein
MRIYPAIFALLLGALQPLPAKAAANDDAGQALLAIHLKDGRTIETDGLQRDGSNIMASVQIGAAKGKVGYAVDSIAKIDFPEPPQFEAATDQLAKGNGKAALAAIEPLVNFYQPYADVPGNLWREAVLLKLEAFHELGMKQEAENLLRQIPQISKDADFIKLVQVLQTPADIQSGHPEKAEQICASVIASSTDPETLAYAWLNKGLALGAELEWEESALACLHVPVFYYQQKLLIPPALLETARAIAALGDTNEAKRRYHDLIDGYPASPEAAVAKIELQKKEKP